MRVGDDFEDEYPGASALATECYANLCRAGTMLMELHNRQTREDYQLSPSAREILAIIEGAGQPLEPSVIAERLLITTGSMTSLLDTLQKRGLIRRLPHPGDIVRKFSMARRASVWSARSLLPLWDVVCAKREQAPRTPNASRSSVATLPLCGLGVRAFNYRP